MPAAATLSTLGRDALATLPGYTGFTGAPETGAQFADQLRALAPAGGVIEVEQFANLGQRQAETLATQEQLDADAVALPIDAVSPTAAWRQQPLILVEADRAGGEREFLGEVGNAVRGRRRPGRHRSVWNAAGRGAFNIP
jgi:hypothetical protein